MGGRGATSGTMGGGFTSAGRGFGGEDNSKILYPAEFNTQGRFSSRDATIQKFADKYKNANVEYGVSVDEQGFVHRHVRGNSTSVAISAVEKNHTTIHNHPTQGPTNFSSTDLNHFTMSKNEKTMIALNATHTVSITKGNNFNSKGFNKAMRRAKWPIKYNYSDGADWWLKRNAKKYGYTYTRKNTK